MILASASTPPTPPLAPPPSSAPQHDSVFDLLYDRYLPFRLYADYMLGVSPAQLAKQFGISEQWITARIDSVRFCLEKQVRLNLLDRV